jgi:hypothetical protein
VVGPGDISVVSDWLGPGYGHPTPEGERARALLSEKHGLSLDLTYTAKTMAALLALLEDGRLEGPTLYWHIQRSTAAVSRTRAGRLSTPAEGVSPLSERKVSNGSGASCRLGMEADVVVVGSGPAGMSARHRRRQKGASVVLIERFPVGGMSTLIPVATWPLNTAVETGELDMPYDGICGEILDRMKALNAIELHTTFADGVDRFVPLPEESDRVATSKWYLFDPEALKYLYFDMLREARVKLMVNSLVVDTEVRDKQVEVVVVETLTRREKIRSKVFIDATGSADVVVRAGAPAVLGAGHDDGVPAGVIMPTSTTFRIAGVETDGLDMYEVARMYEERRLKGEINVPLEGLFWQIVCRGVVQIFGTRVFGVNPLDPHQAAYGEMEQRRQIRDITDFLRREIPAFHNCRLINTGMSIGMIGTRRIRGEYFITSEDISKAENSRMRSPWHLQTRDMQPTATSSLSTT